MMKELSKEQIIQTLNLQPHPEGGYFCETYKSEDLIPQNILGSNFDGSRHYSTCIYFLLTSENFSAFHRIKQDEGWHFYMGSPIRLHAISPEGTYSEHLIGLDMEKGQRPQLFVPAGYWFASEVVEEDSYSLAGCTVSPGFDYADFEMAEADKLVESFPQHEDIIRRLTRQ